MVDGLSARNREGELVKIDLLRDSAKLFKLSFNPEEVTSLRVWNCKYRSLKAIEECVNLRELVIAPLPDDSIDFLAGLKKLEYLRILHMPKVHHVSALAELDALICLSLATSPGWDSSHKRTVIDTLEPIGGLPSIKHIELFNIVSADGSLDPLARLPHLESARFSGYSVDEVERFYAMTRAQENFNPNSSFD